MAQHPDEQPVHCIHYLPRINLEDGGVVRFVLDVCSVLAAQGMRVTLVTQDATDIPENWLVRDDRPSVLVVDQHALPGGLLTRQSLKSIAVLFGANTILSLHVPWLLSNYQLASVAGRCGIPYVVTPHGSLDDWSMRQKALKKKLFWCLFGRRHYHRAAYIHFTAASERDQALSYASKTETQVIPCLFDTEPYAKLPEKQKALKAFPAMSECKPNLLFVSRLHPKKGVEILIEAANLLQIRGVNFNLIIAGPEDDLAKGYRAHLETLVADFQLSCTVHLVGMVDGDEKLALYRSCDLFVLPTHQENFGFVLIEAMACGTPVLTSFGVDIWKEIEEAGASVVENTPHEVAKEIDRLLEDLPLLAKVGIQSRAWVFDALDSKKIAAKYFAMYSGTANKS